MTTITWNKCGSAYVLIFKLKSWGLAETGELMNHGIETQPLNFLLPVHSPSHRDRTKISLTASNFTLYNP